MAVLKRKGHWYVAFMIDGQRVRKCSPDNSKAGAMAYEAQLRHRVANGLLTRVSEKTKSIKLKDFVPVWLSNYVRVYNKPSSIVSKEMILRKHLIPYFGETDIDKISKQMISEFTAKQQVAGSADKTINNQLGTLRKLLVTAEEWNYKVVIPKIKPLRVMVGSIDFLTVDECDALMAMAENPWHDMILLVVKGGLRFGELVALKWQDIDFANTKITISHTIVRDLPQDSTKSNKIRYIAFGNEINTMFKARQANSTSEYIFSDRRGKFLKSDFCRTNLEKIRIKAGITKKVGWHLLRHSFASHLSEIGRSPIVIQKLLGHSDIKTTMRYAHLGEQVTRDAILSLERPDKNDVCHKFATSQELAVETVTADG